MFGIGFKTAQTDLNLHRTVGVPLLERHRAPNRGSAERGDRFGSSLLTSKNDPAACEVAADAANAANAASPSNALGSELAKGRSSAESYIACFANATGNANAGTGRRLTDCVTSLLTIRMGIALGPFGQWVLAIPSCKK